MTNFVEFKKFLSANNLCTVCVNHFTQRNDSGVETYSYHYTLFDKDEDLQQNCTHSDLSELEISIGVIELIMSNKTYQLYTTSKDETLKIWIP